MFISRKRFNETLEEERNKICEQNRLESELRDMHRNIYDLLTRVHQLEERAGLNPQSNSITAKVLHD